MPTTVYREVFMLIGSNSKCDDIFIGRKERSLKFFLDDIIKCANENGLIYKSTISDPPYSFGIPIGGRRFYKKRLITEIAQIHQRLIGGQICYFTLRHNLDFIVFDWKLLMDDCNQDLSKQA